MPDSTKLMSEPSTDPVRLDGLIRERDALRAELGALAARFETANHESHHRLKNVLHLACSLLSLQRNRVSGDETRHELDAAVERITVLGAAYGGQAAEDGVAARALLGTLCSELATAHASDGRITLAVDLAEVALRIEQATALALIVSELVTNSLRHGFPDGRSGQISVRLARAGRQGWELTVADDGIGLDAARGEKGFGLQLVKLMTGQLRGTLAQSGEGGTTHRLRFGATAP